MIIKDVEYHKKALHEISEQIKQLRKDAVSQLFVYALALRCAWFDENDYYEFVPSDIVLRFCDVPKHRIREFFVRNKERRYFTSKAYYEKMSDSCKEVKG